MNCNGCGACCLDEAVPVRPWAGDTINPEFIDEEGNLKLVNGHCVFFDPIGRVCKNYANRPSLCRSLEVGCGRCHVSRLWADLELNWFGVGPRTPERGSFEGFYQRVTHEPRSIKIAALDGADDERTKSAIDRFNALIASATDW